jgi:Domain of unknown function (DUF4157)
MTDHARAMARPQSARNAQHDATSQRSAAVKPRSLVMAKRIGTVSDPLEREADRAADAVLAGGRAGPLSHAPAPSPQRKCAACEAQDDLVQRKCATCDAKAGGQEHAADAAAEAVSSGGAPLPPNLRAYFEPRFAHNLSDVRVHTHGGAVGAAMGIGARAYTSGSNIAFAPGQYAPAANEGRRLIAHELAHVVQQGGASDVVRRQADPDSVFELDAPEKTRPESTEEGLKRLRTEHLIASPPSAEPPCPPLPTNLGNLTPSPDCNHGGGDLPEANLFQFCADSDVFTDKREVQNLRDLVGRQPSGSEFQVRTYSSPEGPGSVEARELYNRNLSCHRLNRVIRELLNAGVQEADIDGAALGATSQFGATAETNGFNRAAAIHPVPQAAKGPRPSDKGMTPTQIAEAGRKRLIDQDYKLAADGYFSRWTCGRYRTLADAVSRTQVVVASQGDAQGPGTELGTTSDKGPNTIILDREIELMNDPIECAANRIADLTFHHFARPVLPGFDDRHRGGMHLVFLAGMGPCVSGTPGAARSQISTPTATDPFAGFRPDCADAPLPGAMSSQKGPAKPSEPAIFISSRPTLVGGGGGSLVDTPSSNRIAVGVDPAEPFQLSATVDASGDPATLARHEIGFIQTVLSEDWVNTYVDGRREVRHLPLPLRDGAARGDALAAPPWFSASNKVKAQPGLNSVSLEDGPNFRAFRFLPDVQSSSFADSRNFTPGKQGGTLERPNFKPGTTPLIAPKPPSQMSPDERKAFAEAQRTQFLQQHNNGPDKGHRNISLMTWVVARPIGAPATLGATEFLEGVKIDYRLGVDWAAKDEQNITGSGTFKTTVTPASRDDSSQMLLRGATPQDFFSADGVPLFAEFLKTEGALPRDKAHGLTQSEFQAAVRAIVAGHLPAQGLAPPLVVRIKLDAATGRVVLDTGTLDRKSVIIEGSSAGGQPPDPKAAAAMALAIYPEIRKLVLSGPLSGAQPTSDSFSFPVTIQR